MKILYKLVIWFVALKSMIWELNLEVWRVVMRKLLVWARCDKEGLFVSLTHELIILVHCTFVKRNTSMFSTLAISRALGGLVRTTWFYGHYLHIYICSSFELPVKLARHITILMWALIMITPKLIFIISMPRSSETNNFKFANSKY